MYCILDIDGVLNHTGTKERFRNYIGIDEGNLHTFAEFLKIARMEEETTPVLSDNGFCSRRGAEIAKCQKS